MSQQASKPVVHYHHRIAALVEMDTTGAFAKLNLATIVTVTLG